MSDRRLLFQAELEAITGNGNVYFQPPPDLQIAYPCIVYSRDNANTQFADNKPYRRMRRYQVTIIDPHPSSPWFDKVADMARSLHSRSYVVGKLNHDVFSVYF